MSRALALSSDFYQASISLKDLLTELQEGFYALSLSSTEVYQNLKQDLISSWKNWPKTVEDYKSSIQDMPRELKQRPFIRQTLKNIEDFENDVLHFFSEVREASFQDFRAHLEQRIRNADNYFKGLNLRIREMMDEVADLEEHSLVKKFLKGETVLSSRKNIQWGRKFLHTSMGLSFLYLFVYSGLSKTFIWSLTGVFLVFSFSLELARHKNPKVNEWVWLTFRRVMREGEKTKINAAIFYILSMAIVYFCFPIQVALLTMLFIAVGDPVAGIVGVYWGKRKISADVSLEGSMACFVTCAALAAFSAGYLFDTHLFVISLTLFSLLSGLVGAIAEASLKKLDDNFVMPLLSAPALWILMKMFGIL